MRHPVRDRERRRLRLLQVNAFESFLAVAGLVSVASYLTDPGAVERSAVGRLLHPFDWVWLAGYAVGALAMLYGALADKVKFQAAGLIAFATAISINLVAVVVVTHPAPWATIALYGTTIATCLARASLLMRGVTVVLAPPYRAPTGRKAPE